MPNIFYTYFHKVRISFSNKNDCQRFGFTDSTKKTGQIKRCNHDYSGKA
jgi:hypothetical protein